MRPLSLCLLLVAGPAFGLELLILSPRSSQPVFGAVEVAVKVMSTEPVVEVIFRLDGEEVGRLERAPYRLLLDVGTDNVEHLFEVVAVGASGEESTETLTTPTLRIDNELQLELQQLYVNVTRKGNRTLDLRQAEFQVLDDGKPQKLVTFERGDVPLTAVLLIDTSFSMRGERLRAALSGARSFIRGMQELDLAKLILFSDKTQVSTPFTQDAGILDQSVLPLEAAHGTAINDHLYMALEALEELQGRRVIVLLSDGVDVESVLDIADILWKAKRAQPLVYWIRPDALAPEQFNFYSLWRDPEGHRRNIQGLQKLVLESGGRIYDIESGEEAPKVFTEIADDLREQYVFGYYPSRNLDDDSWHEVRVRARGARVRTRSGYWDVAR